MPASLSANVPAGIRRRVWRMEQLATASVLSASTPSQFRRVYASSGLSACDRSAIRSSASSIPTE